jgi:riboflavin biosynthesis pyrimidine reductase
MNRPYVIVCQDASVDGRLTISPDTLLLFGDERWSQIAVPGENLFEKLRSEIKPQATLEGSGSFMREDGSPEPLPPVEGDPASLYEDYLPEKIVRRGGQRGWFTVVDGGGRVRWMYKEWPDEAWKGWYPLVLAHRSTPPEYLEYLQREEIPYLIAGEGKVDLQEALEKMCALLGVERMISTAGGRLNGALLRAGLVDEVYINFLPALIGGRNTSSLFAAPDLKPGEQPVKLELVECGEAGNGVVRLHYRVIK